MNIAKYLVYLVSWKLSLHSSHRRCHFYNAGVGAVFRKVVVREEELFVAIRIIDVDGVK